MTDTDTATEKINLRKRMQQLEPLAHLYERSDCDCFRVCYDIYQEYRGLYNHLQRIAIQMPSGDTGPYKSLLDTPLNGTPTED